MENKRTALIVVGIAGVAGVVLLRRGLMNKIEGFVEDHKAYAKAVAKEYDLGDQAWKFILVQGAHESGYGLSGLTKKANNLFGFTGEYWEKIGKPVVRMMTSENIKGTETKMTRPFRRYATTLDSMKDYARLLTTKSNYKKAVEQLKAGNLQRAIDEMGRSGYATQPDYGARLTRNLTEMSQYLA